jgi:hypothetical protein
MSSCARIRGLLKVHLFLDDTLCLILQVAYTVMYLPVQSTLMCLSKLYRAVDARIFSGLAQEAVSACTLSIQQAARMVCDEGWVSQMLAM